MATSVASARVGRGARIIDSSIWVATIDGPAGATSGAEQVLLQQGDLLHGQLDAQVTSRDHQRVGDAQDRLDVLDGGLGLDLGDDGHDALAHEAPELLDVVGTTHERLRDQIDVHVERAGQAFTIARR